MPPSWTDEWNVFKLPCFFFIFFYSVANNHICLFRHAGVKHIKIYKSCPRVSRKVDSFGNLIWTRYFCFVNLLPLTTAQSCFYSFDFSPDLYKHILHWVSSLGDTFPMDSQCFSILYKIIFHGLIICGSLHCEFKK